MAGQMCGVVVMCLRCGQQHARVCGERAKDSYGAGTHHKGTCAKHDCNAWFRVTRMAPGRKLARQFPKWDTGVEWIEMDGRREVAPVVILEPPWAGGCC